ncbi:LANO_0G17612g1_1 [Lachancea nothofagi CBS 11611]|uniref:LANO_0G17612g1_1 n=1 Tax=Lachancea nothofagi CBS 11611 TaxID=1266666 RepID=A0A1G4KKX2_9SACH|nr:LANO_0G17612g1_1 [Lachancea nothofagi CBS 11611]
MGWFNKTKPMDDQSKPPLRSSRKQCWESRDGFFQCLDKISVVNALESKHEDAIQKSCKTEEGKFEEDCATSWIKYFKEKRVVDYKREKFMQEMESKNGQQIDLSGMIRK